MAFTSSSQIYRFCGSKGKELVLFFSLIGWFKTMKFLNFLEVKEKHLKLWRTLEILFPIKQKLPISLVIFRIFNLKSSSAYFFLCYPLFFYFFSLFLFYFIVQRPGQLPKEECFMDSKGDLQVKTENDFFFTLKFRTKRDDYKLS